MPIWLVYVPMLLGPFVDPPVGAWFCVAHYHYKLARLYCLDMVGSKLPTELGKTEFVYLQLYRLRTLSDEEKHEWLKEWASIKQSLPKEIKVIVEAGNAFGTDFTGFTVYEGPIESFQKLVETLEKRTTHVVEKSLTIIGTKGYALPIEQFQKILDKRPID